MENRYDIFLSHSSANKKLVRDLFADIEKENCNGRNLTAWFDEVDIAPGKSITGMVNSGLTQCNFFAIVMTPEYFGSSSGWTDAEWHSILFDDPDNRSGKILPILALDCPNLPPLLKHLKYIDIRGNHYGRGVSQIIEVLTSGNLRRQSKQRSNSTFNHLSGSFIRQSEPDKVSERLSSNIFPVLQIPEKVYFGKIKAELMQSEHGEVKMPSKNDLKILLYKIQLEKGGKVKPYMPAFRTHKNQIVTFYNLNDKDTLLCNIVEDVTSEKTVDLSEDEDKSLVVSLLNMSISRHVFRCGLVQDQARPSRFYFPADNGESNVVVWKSFKNKASRTVAKPVKVFEDYSLWLHQGANIKLIRLAKKFYLQVIPTWVLTINGNTPAGGNDVAKIVNKWTNAERNLSVLRHLKFWSSILSKGKSQILVYCGSSFIKINSMSSEIQMQLGIKDDQVLLLDDIEMTSIDDIIEGRLSDDIEQDLLDIDDLSEDDEEDESYEEEQE